MKICQFCEKQFNPKSKNQKYCNPDCCRKATNKKIMQKYYENKERLNGKVRFCSSCNFKLSIYNAGKNCYKCESENLRNNKKLLKEALDYVIKQAK